jgi:hypothetical protein
MMASSYIGFMYQRFAFSLPYALYRFFQVLSGITSRFTVLLLLLLVHRIGVARKVPCLRDSNITN